MIQLEGFFVLFFVQYEVEIKVHFLAICLFSCSNAFYQKAASFSPLDCSGNIVKEREEETKPSQLTLSVGVFPGPLLHSSDP